MDLEPVAGPPAAAAEPSGPVTTLAELEKLALERNPRMASARAMVDSGSGRVRQAGLYPNPSIGVTGDHVSAATNGGAIGGFVEQRIVTGGKLHWARQVASEEKAGTEQMAEAEKLRVLTLVRTLFYQALGDQALVETRVELASLGHRTAAIVRELANIGQADSPDVLATDNEAERLEVDLESARRGLEQSKVQLAALVDGAPIGKLEGKLEEIPKLDKAGALAKILGESPEVKAAAIEMDRAQASLKRARVDVIPDLMLRGGVRDNRELNGLERIGLDGIFDVSVQLPIFNRNQGAIASAKADAERARYDASRVKLELRSRLAVALRQYDESVFAAEHYESRILPQAKKAVDQYLGNFRNMAVSYPLVLAAERSLAQSQEAYIHALVEAHQAAVAVDGMLLGEMR
jgi:cobalt-zinc-cadmium efflux system outer membrane protein